MDFEYIPQYMLGVASNLVNVETKQGRVIGYLEAKDVPAFQNGEVSLLEPIKSWKNTFSIDLKKKLGLY